jgi:nitrate/nitrite transporter NarK
VIAPDLHWLSVSVLLVTTLELILGVIVAILGPNTDYTVTVYIVITIFKLLVAKTASDAAQTYQFSTLRNGAIGKSLAINLSHSKTGLMFEQPICQQLIHF